MRPFAVELLAMRPHAASSNRVPQVFGATKQHNGEQSQELSAGSILYCRLLELGRVGAARPLRRDTRRFFLECFS
jgi:hypothetical protein